MRFLLLSFLFFFVSCGVDRPCEKKDTSFRPHRVSHCNKSKVYKYYHNDPCDCPGLEVDLCYNCNYQKTYRNYVEFYDTGERMYGK